MPLRVVLVDDDARFRALARRILTAEGLDVVAEVADGADALAVVEACAPDVVVVDVRMPGVDGPEVARRLQAGVPGVAVILVSTIDRASGRRLAAGVALGYLPKDELSLAAIQGLMPGSAACSR
jgi:CheY-like chemotaxis protein